MDRRLITAVLVGACVLLGGCQNPWKDAYLPSHRLGDTRFEATPSAEVSFVEWERLEEYLEARRARSIGRDVPAERVPTSTALEEMREFLRVVRVDAPAQRVVVLGEASFIDRRYHNPYGKLVQRLAREKGADYAVVSVKPLGLRPTVEYATRTEVHEREFYDYELNKKQGRIEHRVTDRTPVVVVRDSWAYTLYLLRVAEPEVAQELLRGRPWLP